MPVLPEVGSMMVPPGWIKPSFSACSIIARPIRSLTLASGIARFQLADDLARQVLAKAAQPHQRRAADQLTQAVRNLFGHDGLGPSSPVRRTRRLRSRDRLGWVLTGLLEERDDTGGIRQLRSPAPEAVQFQVIPVTYSLATARCARSREGG